MLHFGVCHMHWRFVHSKFQIRQMALGYVSYEASLIPVSVLQQNDIYMSTALFSISIRSTMIVAEWCKSLLDRNFFVSYYVHF